MGKEDRDLFKKKLGKRIAELRIAKRMSTSDLARAAGKDPQTIFKVENGITNASAFFLSELAAAMQVPLKDLLDF